MSHENSLSVRLSDAQHDGSISAESLAILNEASRGRQHQDVGGTKPRDFKHDNPLIATILVDDSYSMDDNTGAVRIGQNAVVDALVDSHDPKGVLIRTDLLNRGPLHEHRPILDVKNLEAARLMRLNEDNYQLDQGGTPLFRRILTTAPDILGLHRAFFDDYRDTVHTAWLIVSDGLDNSAFDRRRGGVNLENPEFLAQIAQVRTVLTDMRRTEVHLIAGMAIDDGTHLVRQIMLMMGIPERWILEPGSTPDQIRAAFGEFARVAQEATRAGNFAQLMQAGFSSYDQMQAEGK